MTTSALENAVDDLRTTLAELTWLKVIEGVQEPGGGSYSLFFAVGSHNTTYHYGARKIRQSVILTLFVKQGTDAGGISDKLDLINQKIINDRRRATYAQTTTIGEWTAEDNQGKEGLTMSMITEVHVYES